MKNGNRVSFGYTCFNSVRKEISLEEWIESEKVKKGIVRDSDIVFVIAFLIPVICFTLLISKEMSKNLLVFIRDAGEWRNFMSKRLCSVNNLASTWLVSLISIGLPRFDILEHIRFKDTPIPASRFNLIYVESFPMQQSPHSRT